MLIALLVPIVLATLVFTAVLAKASIDRRATPTLETIDTKKVRALGWKPGYTDVRKNVATAWNFVEKKMQVRAER